MNAADREATLRRRLERVRRRIADDVPHSPDWDAAMAELEEVELALELALDSARESAREAVTGGTTSWPGVGPLSPSAET